MATLCKEKGKEMRKKKSIHYKQATLRRKQNISALKQRKKNNNNNKNTHTYCYIQNVISENGFLASSFPF